MHGGTQAQGFPPKPGEVTARFVMAVDHHVPSVMEDVPMLTYSPASRCGVFYLARIKATLLDSQYIPKSGQYPLTVLGGRHLYGFVATYSKPMPEAVSFTYDDYGKKFCVFYGPDEGVGPPGR